MEAIQLIACTSVVIKPHTSVIKPAAEAIRLAKLKPNEIAFNSVAWVQVES